MRASPSPERAARIAEGSSRPFRVLFLGEGDLGTIMGHAAQEEALRAGLEGVPDLEARFRSLPPLRGVAGLATRSVPLLKDADLDFQSVRWHLVQSLRLKRMLRDELARRPVDAVHVDSHAVALALSADMRRLPVFLSLDATVWEFRRFGIWRPVRPHSRLQVAPSVALERRAFRGCRAVFARTEWSKRGVERMWPGARVVVLHPGVDLEAFHPRAREERPRPRLLFVGSNFEKKGGRDLLAALADELGRTVDVDVVTRGDIPTGPGVTVHHLGVYDARLVRLYAQADVFCLPTHADVAPFAVLEAMASGTPVVASALGGIPELLDDGRAGRLVPVRDPGALRAALLGLLADEPARRALGAAARARCEERFDARRQSRRLVDLMREAV